MGRLASVLALRLIKALKRLGWSVNRQSGSHAILTKPGRSPITVPVHKGRTMKEGTERSILTAAGIGEEEFFDVY